MIFLKNIFKSREEIYQEVLEEKSGVKGLVITNREETVDAAPKITFPVHWELQPQPAGSAGINGFCKDSLFEISITSKNGYYYDSHKQKYISIFLRPKKGGVYWYVIGGGVEGIGNFRTNRQKSREQYNQGLILSTSLHARFESYEQEEMIETIERCFNSEIE